MAFSLGPRVVFRVSFLSAISCSFRSVKCWLALLALCKLLRMLCIHVMNVWRKVILHALVNDRMNMLILFELSSMCWSLLIFVEFF